MGETDVTRVDKEIEKSSVYREIPEDLMLDAVNLRKSLPEKSPLNIEISRELIEISTNVEIIPVGGVECLVDTLTIRPNKKENYRVYYQSYIPIALRVFNVRNDKREKHSKIFNSLGASLKAEIKRRASIKLGEKGYDPSKLVRLEYLDNEKGIALFLRDYVDSLKRRISNGTLKKVPVF